MSSILTFLHHPLVKSAARFADKAHEGQRRKYNGDRYIYHPTRVAMRTSCHPQANPELIAAAYLHDTVEDTPVSLADIEREFGMVVMTYVEWLTNPSKDSMLPRADRKAIDRAHIAGAPQRVKVVKLIDRIDNLMEIDLNAALKFAKLYAAESLALLDVIHDGDMGLADEMREIIFRINPLADCHPDV